MLPTWEADNKKVLRALSCVRLDGVPNRAPECVSGQPRFGKGCISALIETRLVDQGQLLLAGGKGMAWADSRGNVQGRPQHCPVRL